MLEDLGWYYPGRTREESGLGAGCPGSSGLVLLERSGF